MGNTKIEKPLYGGFREPGWSCYTDDNGSQRVLAGREGSTPGDKEVGVTERDGV